MPDPVWLLPGDGLPRPQRVVAVLVDSTCDFPPLLPVLAHLDRRGRWRFHDHVVQRRAPEVRFWLPLDPVPGAP